MIGLIVLGVYISGIVIGLILAGYKQQSSDAAPFIIFWPLFLPVLLLLMAGGKLMDFGNNLRIARYKDNKRHW